MLNYGSVEDGDFLSPARYRFLVTSVREGINDNVRMLLETGGGKVEHDYGIKESGVSACVD